MKYICLCYLELVYLEVQFYLPLHLVETCMFFHAAEVCYFLHKAASQKARYPATLMACLLLFGLELGLRNW